MSLSMDAPWRELAEAQETNRSPDIPCDVPKTCACAWIKRGIAQGQQKELNFPSLSLEHRFGWCLTLIQG